MRSTLTRSMMHGLAALLAVLLLPSLSGAWNLTDETGRSLTLPGPPRRIVSLVPSVTETLFAIGAQDTLVGVTDFCDYPPLARAKPSVGGMLAPSLETLAALKPDLVIATTAGNREETFVEIERLKIPVYLVNPVRMSDVLDLISRLGALTRRENDAARLVASLDARIKAVVTRVSQRGRPRVLYVLWPDPLIVPGRGALVSELLGLAGGESVTGDASEAYPRYSLEAAVAREPDVIILASHGSRQGPVAREKWERFGHLPAIKTGRLYTADGNLMHRYGPRVVDGLELLARLLHPEAFGSAAESQKGSRP
ncbi:MAG: cobalamin-binding protein [Candidatus Rokuibacteriota bacterium]|nr:MAG: cobalamin-binding protein [Candidatus Rokubacteria bacterium]